MARDFPGFIMRAGNGEIREVYASDLNAEDHAWAQAREGVTIEFCFDVTSVNGEVVRVVDSDPRR